MSAAAGLLLGFSAWVVLARAGVAPSGLLAFGFLKWATWVIFGYLTLNTVMNLASSNPTERWCGLGVVTSHNGSFCTRDPLPGPGGNPRPCEKNDRIHPVHTALQLTHP